MQVIGNEGAGHGSAVFCVFMKSGDDPDQAALAQY